MYVYVYVARSHEELSKVNRGALKAEPTERVIYLANPKQPHSEYRYERSVYTQVPRAAQSAAASPRVEQLASPKWGKLEPLPVLSLGHICDPIQPVPGSARKGNCTPRVEQLAEHKGVPPEYRMEKPVQWHIPHAVINATATTRLQQLARPKSCKLKEKDVDPYKVPLAAIKARPTARVEELAVPVPRKVRQKKN